MTRRRRPKSRCSETVGKRNPNGGDRARQLLAQEAARIIVDQGIRDYRVAKIKAAERLGFNDRGSLPGNAEIEFAVSEHLTLFGGGEHADFLRQLREVAVSAMEMLASYTPRLVGPVLNGTADDHSAVNLHLFADSPELVAMELDGRGISYRPFDRRLRAHRNRKTTADVFAAFEFMHEHAAVEATVFPVDGIRQAPISPIDGKPMRRADLKAVRALL